MKIVVPELCVYCLADSTKTRRTDKYCVGVCDKHDYLTDKEINDIIRDEMEENTYEKPKSQLQ